MALKSSVSAAATQELSSRAIQKNKLQQQTVEKDISSRVQLDKRLNVQQTKQASIKLKAQNVQKTQKLTNLKVQRAAKAQKTRFQKVDTLKNFASRTDQLKLASQKKTQAQEIQKSIQTKVQAQAKVSQKIQKKVDQNQEVQTKDLDLKRQRLDIADRRQKIRDDVGSSRKEDLKTEKTLLKKNPAFLSSIANHRAVKEQ